MTDDAQIAALFERACQAWSDGDASAYGECFTADADYISFDGSRADGRAPMVEAHDKLFRGVLFRTSLVGEVESIRYLADDVALVHATGSVLVPWRSRLPRRRLTRSTIVAVRTEAGWRFSAMHNGRVRPLQIPDPESLLARVARGVARASQTLGIGHRARRQGTAHPPHPEESGRPDEARSTTITS